MKRLVLLYLLLCPGCGPDGLTLGLTGCESAEGGFVPTEANTVERGVHATVTAAGVRALLEHKEALVGLLFAVDEAGWVHLELPAVEFGARDGFGVGVRDVKVRFDLRAVDLDVSVRPDPARVRVEVRDAVLRLDDGVVWVAVGGNAACHLGHGTGPGAPEDTFLHLDFAFDVAVQVDEAGRLRAEVSDLDFTTHRFDLHLEYDERRRGALPECADGITDVECSIACRGGDLFSDIIEALRDALEGEVDRLLRPVVQAAISFLVGRFTEQPLAVEGAVHPRLLRALVPTLSDAHPLGFRVAPTPLGLAVRSAGGDGDGVALTVDVGLDAVEHPCVPAVEGAPAFAAGRPPALTGYDHAGQPYHLGLSASEAVVNRALWVAYRGGVLCLTLDSAQMEALLGLRLDSELLSLVLPGLAELTGGPRPVMVALDPDFTAADFPLARFFEIEDDGGLPQAGIAVTAPGVRVSFYTLVEERWTRLLQASVDVAVDVVVQAAPGDRLVLSVGTPQVGELVEHYNELLDRAEIPALLALMVDLVTAVFLHDGVTLELGIDGLISQLTGLPFDARVAALRTEGEGGDFLSVLLSVVPAAAGAGAQAAVDTAARVEALDPATGRARLRVDAAGAPSARFQWRVDGGPWRPLAPAPEGVLDIADPRLRVLGEHRLEVRAVAEGDYRTLDPTPAVLTVESRPPDPRLAGGVAPAGGCRTAPGAPVGVGALLLLGALGLRRRRLLLLLPLLGGCDERRSAADAPCETSADCPGRLVCIDRVCRRPAPCEQSAECCPGAECRAGACMAPEAVCAEDGDCGRPDLTCVAGLCEHRPCAGECGGGARCVAGHCHLDPPCMGACGADEACFAHLDGCRRAPPACDQSCGPGHLRVVRGAAAYRGPLCDLSGATCACERTPPLLPADFGRHASMALLGGQAVFAAYDADFGDLVFVEGVESGAPRVTYLDGVPPSAPAVADPAGPRGGRLEAGPDRGRYASLAVDPKARPHIVYYDADAEALRYVRGDGEGRWIEPIVIDDDGDAGRYARIAIDSAGAPHIVYYVAATREGQTQLRYATTAAADPGPGDFVVQVVSARARPESEPAAPPPGVTPRGHGVMPCLRVGRDGRIYLAFYDGEARWLFLARSEDAGGFLVERAVGRLAEDWPADPGGRYARFEEHDVGRACDLVVDPDGRVTAVFVDEDTDALLAWRGRVGEEGIYEVVDPGGRGLRRLVGADTAMDVDDLGRPVVVYQEQTENDVLMAVRFDDGWPARPLVVADAGAQGFYNSLRVLGRQAVVGTLELKTLRDGRGAHRLHVYRLDVPAF